MNRLKEIILALWDWLQDAANWIRDLFPRKKRQRVNPRYSPSYRPGDFLEESTFDVPPIQENFNENSTGGGSGGGPKQKAPAVEKKLENKLMPPTPKPPGMGR